MGDILHLYFNLGYWWASFPALLRGAATTVQLAACVLVIGTGLGFALAIARAAGPSPIPLAVIVFADAARAIPSIVLLFLLFFGLPYAEIRISGFWCAVAALAANLAAVSEEAFWAGIRAVPRGQYEAAASLGVRRLTALCLVVLPQGFRLGVPPLTGKAISITKDTALASVVAVPELLNQMSTEQGVYANPSPLMLGALMFLVMFAPLVQASRRFERGYKWMR